MAATDPPASLAALMAQLEELWRHYDEVFEGLRSTDWRRKHGREWVCADVPYHLAYFDSEVVAGGIAHCGRVPPGAETRMYSHGEFVAWNNRHFAARSAGQTASQSIVQMRASREAIRQAVAALGNSDPGQPVWISLTTYGGWRTVRFALELCRMHAWCHFTQLRLHLGRSEPRESPCITHGALDGYIRSMPVLLNRAQAARTEFTLVMKFSGPGGGDWTVRVSNGMCKVSEGLAAQAALVITQSPETFVKILAAMAHPLPAILRGQITVRGYRNLARFMRLFPKPRPGQVLEPIP